MLLDEIFERIVKKRGPASYSVTREITQFGDIPAFTTQQYNSYNDQISRVFGNLPRYLRPHALYVSLATFLHHADLHPLYDDADFRYPQYFDVGNTTLECAKQPAVYIRNGRGVPCVQGYNFIRVPGLIKNLACGNPTKHDVYYYVPNEQDFIIADMLELVIHLNKEAEPGSFYYFYPEFNGEAHFHHVYCTPEVLLLRNLTYMITHPERDRKYDIPLPLNLFHNINCVRILDAIARKELHDELIALVDGKPNIIGLQRYIEPIRIATQCNHIGVQLPDAGSDGYPYNDNDWAGFHTHFFTRRKVFSPIFFGIPDTIVSQHVHWTVDFNTPFEGAHVITNTSQLTECELKRYEDESKMEMTHIVIAVRHNDPGQVIIRGVFQNRILIFRCVTFILISFLSCSRDSVDAEIYDVSTLNEVPMLDLQWNLEERNRIEQEVLEGLTLIPVSDSRTAETFLKSTQYRLISKACAAKYVFETIE